MRTHVFAAAVNCHVARLDEPAAGAGAGAAAIGTRSAGCNARLVTPRGAVFISTAAARDEGALALAWTVAFVGHTL